MADGGTFQFAYTLSSGKVTETDVTDQRGNIRKAIFNSDGYMTSDTRAYGTSQAEATTISRQSSSGLINNVTDALSRETSYSYDSVGNVTGITRLYGTGNAVTTSLTYDSTFNQLTSVTDLA